MTLFTLEFIVQTQAEPPRPALRVPAAFHQRHGDRLGVSHPSQLARERRL